MAKELKGLPLKGWYLGFHEVLGKDKSKYLYGQMLQRTDGGKFSIVDVRVKNLNVLESCKEVALNDADMEIITVDVGERLTKDGKPFMVVDAA